MAVNVDENNMVNLAFASSCGVLFLVGFLSGFCYILSVFLIGFDKTWVFYGDMQEEIQQMS